LSALRNRPPVATLATLVLVLVFRAGAWGAEIPFLSGRVNDQAGVLSPETVRDLGALLKAHEDSTSNQVVVLTIPNLEGEVLEEYSLRVAEAWKLGQKGRDNGVLLLVARDDRKVRIEVGSGLEGVLPDILCGRIIRDNIIPHFRKNDYDGGIRAGVEAILAVIRGEYVAPAKGFGRSAVWVSLIAGAIFIVVVGTFTVIALLSKGGLSWFLYLFLIPFWFGFPVAILGMVPGLGIFALYLVGFLLLKYWFAVAPSGRAWLEQTVTSSGFTPGGVIHGSGGGWASSGGGFSGGGGGFSGGGASGSW
jgi:uncharacterized protein